MTIAFVFPGQGAHKEGMAAAWEGHPAHTTFAEVGRACGLDDLARLADDAEACARTAIAQPAVFAASIAAWRALTDAGVAPDAVAGHSLGEVAAAVASGALSVADGAALVGERGRAFGDACERNPGAMIAVLGSDADTIAQVLLEVPGASIANDNAPGQVVVAGSPEAVERAAEACRDAGARVIPLDVEGAFHTESMAPAIVRVASCIRRLEVRDPVVPLVSGATARFTVSAEDVTRGLVDGILATVRWRQVQGRLVELGVDAVIEVGPGGVLRGLARRTFPGTTVLSVDSPDAVPTAAASVGIDVLEGSLT